MDAYDPLARALTQAGLRVIVADLRGHGHSDTTFEAYGDEASADDLIALIEHLDAGPAILIGASMSAASAVIAAARRPELVRALVLIGPFLRGPSGIVGRLVMPLLLLRPWGPSVWRAYSARLWPGLPDAQDRAARLSAQLRRPGRWRAFQRTTRTDHRVVEPWLPRVACPSLIIMGEQDPDWTDPAAEAAWAARALGAQGEGAEILMQTATRSSPERLLINSTQLPVARVPGEHVMGVGARQVPAKSSTVPEGEVGMPTGGRRDAGAGGMDVAAAASAVAGPTLSGSSAVRRSCRYSAPLGPCDLPTTPAIWAPPCRDGRVGMRVGASGVGRGAGAGGVGVSRIAHSRPAPQEGSAPPVLFPPVWPAQSA